MRRDQFDGLEDFHNFLKETESAVVFFSGQNCNVCTALKPKVAQLVANKFPQTTFAAIDTTAHPAVAGQLGVLSVPTVIVFFHAKELARFHNAFSLNVLSDAIDRPYQALYPPT